MAKGYTLLELLIVLAILAFVAALAAPTIGAGFGGTSLRSTASELAAELRRTRGLAIAENRITSLVLDLEGRTYRSDHSPGQGQTIPEGLNLRFMTAASEQLSGQAARIRFFPDGSSTGGEIDLGHGEDGQTIFINWLTGRISIHD